MLRLHEKIEKLLLQKVNKEAVDQVDEEVLAGFRRDQVKLRVGRNEHFTGYMLSQEYVQLNHSDVK